MACSGSPQDSMVPSARVTSKPVSLLGFTSKLRCDLLSTRGQVTPDCCFAKKSWDFSDGLGRLLT
jgi:hypothetical protein